MTHKMKNILKTLNDFQILNGFENFNDENAVYIYESEMPFIIKKTEWKRAFLWGMGMSIRTINETWDLFEELGYLQPTGDNEPQAWLQVATIRRDIEQRSASIEAYLEADK